MQQPPQPEKQITTATQTRRDLLKTPAAVSAATLAGLAFPSGVYAQAEGPIKVGLVGCGGRGSGAAINALNVDNSCVLHAMGDMFMDKVESSLNNLMKNDKAKQIKVANDKKYAGFDAYKGVIAECDYVILATPPHFRPMHLRAAIEAGKHVFCEKPVAVDVPGVKKVMEACKLAQDKKLSVISGLCYRYDPAKREVIKRIHDGEIGQLVSLQGMYNTGGLWVNPRKPEWSDMEWQLRNWLYFTWLSGDHIVEQHVHTLDKMLWIMKDVPPMKCTANGGRTQRTGQEYGSIYDHFDTIFEWEVEERPVRAFCQTRQWVNCDTDVSDWVFGTKGVADVMNHRITGENKWRRKEAKENMYDVEHAEGIAAMRKGQPINNGDYMCKATLMGIMGRMAAYSGKTLYWDKAAAKADRKANAPTLMDSTEDLSPPEYKLGPYPAPPVAIPGKTKIA
jgi:myo-inositol 2-dehydrogenase/D-chiro-inositol 1-dehydrogenase